MKQVEKWSINSKLKLNRCFCTGKRLNWSYKISFLSVRINSRIHNKTSL